MRDAIFVSREELVDLVKNLDLWSDEFPDALTLAESVHVNQQRAGGGSYLEEHIYPVTATVARFLTGYDQDGARAGVLVALLHDTIEDSVTVTEDVIVSRFGDDIANRVAILTKPEKRPGTELPQSDEEESQYVAGVMAADFVTRAVKVLDRINNLASVHKRDPERRRRYLDETRQYYLDLASSVDESLATLMQDLLDEQEQRIAKQQNC